MAAQLHIWNLTRETAAELTPDARQSFLNEAAAQFHSQENRNSGIADGIMFLLQSVTLKEGREALKKAETAYKEKHETKRMPGSWRTIKATCLAVKEERESDFNSCESYHKVKGMYKEVTKGRREAKAAKEKEAVSNAASTSEEALNGMSPKDLLDTTNAARREVLERIGALPNAYQVLFWTNEELQSLITSFEQQFEEARKALNGDTSEESSETSSEEPQRAQAAG